jgi:hypothetical protein
MLCERERSFYVDFIDFQLMQAHLRERLLFAELGGFLPVDFLGDCLLIDVRLDKTVASPLILPQFAFQSRPAVKNLAKATLPDIEYY